MQWLDIGRWIGGLDVSLIWPKRKIRSKRKARLAETAPLSDTISLRLS
jgi:hypothetical protein